MAKQVAIIPVGTRFGMIVVTGQPFRTNQMLRYPCRCDCGKETAPYRNNLLNVGDPQRKHCGCMTGKRNGERLMTHGQTKTELYRRWTEMRRRCSDPKNISYQYYGAKGIRVCALWEHSFEAFKEWADGDGYKPDAHPRLTIERKDSNKDYSPDNCKWATYAEQSRNKSDVRLIEFEGKKQCLLDWATSLGVPRGLLNARLRSGWSIDRAFREPSRRSRPGSESHSAKLQEKDVIEIRSLFGQMIYRDIATRFNISTAAVKAIASRRTWRHIA